MTENLERRLRGEITTITTSPEADLWALRKEAAAEIARLTAKNARLREALEVIAGGDGDAQVIAQQTLEANPR
jgi:anti-sigma factor RsiW